MSPLCTHLPAATEAAATETAGVRGEAAAAAGTLPNRRSRQWNSEIAACNSLRPKSGHITSVK